MNEFELIQEFIEGKLDGTGEEMLFSMMSSSEGLRTELKQQLAIKEAIRGDIKAFSPSPTSTIRIFNTLGFQPPVVAPVPVTTNIYKGLLAKYGGFVATSLASVVATGVIIFLFFMPKTGSNSYQAGQQNVVVNDNQSNFSNQNSTNKSNYPVTSSNESENSVKNTQIGKNGIKTRTIIKYVYVNTTDTVNQTTKDNPVDKTPEIIKNDDLVLSESSMFSPSFSKYSIEREKFDYPAVISLNPFNRILSFSESRPLGINLELQGVQNWHLPAASISPADNALFNNSSLSLYYSFSEKISAGLNLRQENFFQVFEGTDSIGNRYRYEQQPNLTTVSAFARFNFAKYGVFSPLVQLSAGLNKSGFAARGMLGTEIYAFPGLSFIVGLEYSHLLYQHQQSTYYAKKLGLNYGLIFKF